MSVAIKAINNWYKPLEKYEDDVTVREVYLQMSSKKKDCVKRLLSHAAKRTMPDSHSESNYIKDVFDTFTNNEKLATYYLLNEAVLYGEDVFRTITCWFLLSQVDI